MGVLTMLNRRVFVTGIRVFLGLIFFSSGMGKLTHGDFFGLIGPVWLADRLAEYHLALWAEFVGWAQVTIGLLLLSQRFATLGAVMLVPMLANILVITISLQWRGTPYVNAVLLAMNLVLLYADRRKLVPMLEEDRGSRRVPWLVIAGIAFGLAAPALHPVHRVLTFACAAIAIVIFAVAALRANAPSTTAPAAAGGEDAGSRRTAR